MYLYNCKIYTGSEVLLDKAIFVEGDKIKDIIPESEIPQNTYKINLKGQNISAGFIDLQVNGGDGVLFNNDITVKGLRKIYSAHLKHGTVNMLPTFITSTFDKFRLAVKVIEEVVKSGDTGILGIHIEGPFINPNKKGTHNEKCITVLTPNEANKMPSLRGCQKLITLAPELVDSASLGILKSKGYVISAGHTDATFGRSNEFFGSGITGVTHLYNAMRVFNHRETGVIGAVLNNDNIWAGIIVDGHHVDYNAVAIAYKCKKGKLFLVTDAMPLACLSDKNVVCTLDGKILKERNGVCVNEEGIISGSMLDMSTAVRNCVTRLSIPLDEALRMASTYPATFMGINNDYGYIKPGYKANMTIFDDNIHTNAVVLNGEYKEF